MEIIDPQKTENVSELVNRIAVNFIEKYDSFVYETILPYCEHYTEMKIDKKELTAALTLWNKRQQIIAEINELPFIQSPLDYDGYPVKLIPHSQVLDILEKYFREASGIYQSENEQEEKNLDSYIKRMEKFL